MTYDGTTVKVNQSGKKALDVVGSVDISENINITGSTKISTLNKENAIVFTNQNGTLENKNTLTYDGIKVKIEKPQNLEQQELNVLEITGSTLFDGDINVNSNINLGNNNSSINFTGQIQENIYSGKCINLKI